MRVLRVCVSLAFDSIHLNLTGVMINNPSYPHTVYLHSASAIDNVHRVHY